MRRIGVVLFVGMAPVLAACGGGQPLAAVDAAITAPRSLATGDFPPATRARAAAFRRTLEQGDAVGTIFFPRAGASVPIRVGFDQATIDRGPGWLPESRLPGEGRLVYVAGHRRTHGGPFGPVARLARGDRVVLTLPYATVTYVVTGRRRISERDTSVLRSPRHEVLRLQTSTLPSGDERVIVTARPRDMRPAESAVTDSG